MNVTFDKEVESFIICANKNCVKMIMVGGGAVNFHGYQRHSADVDFWIEMTEENAKNLLQTFKDLKYNLEEIPERVITGEQNISIKISPGFELELITKFNPGKSFQEAFEDSVVFEKDDLKYRILSFNDLIASKITSERVKDKMDIEELQRIQAQKKK